eukprot:CAMPEP_0179120342 /NCGR_PEP_ID=MMETSP0796-20121207/56695_1 /TAXON_ID=73915 /ORGANISM="Pyrodinium bahamense, Strain pbaha01" /LENGTH=221 /DNA_ID=CAMNT_0020818879 /DNA_START=186 /DNA_END=852 /DNA_ORIENTATION=+
MVIQVNVNIGPWGAIHIASTPFPLLPCTLLGMLGAFQQSAAHEGGKSVPVAFFCNLLAESPKRPLQRRWNGAAVVAAARNRCQPQARCLTYQARILAPAQEGSPPRRAPAAPVPWPLLSVRSPAGSQPRKLFRHVHSTEASPLPLALAQLWRRKCPQLPQLLGGRRAQAADPAEVWPILDPSHKRDAHGRGLASQGERQLLMVPQRPAVERQLLLHLRHAQ